MVWGLGRCLASLWVVLVCSFALQVARAESEGPAEKGGTLSYLKGRQKMLDGDYEGAAKHLEAALKSDPNSIQIQFELGEAYLRLNKFEQAEVLTKNAVGSDPKNATYRMTYAAVLASMKRYPEAKEQYRAVQELEPSNNRIPLLIGMIDAEDGKYDESIATLTKALEANSDNAMIYFYRAKVYLEMEQIPQAKADLEKAISLRPSFTEAGTTLGLLHEKLGEVEQAIAAYSKIQGGGRYKKRLAQLYLQQNEFEKALSELVEYEKLEPDDYTVRVKIGLIHYEMKRFDLAQAQFSKILKDAPDAANVRFYLGVVFEEKREFDRAIAEFKKVQADSSFFKEAMIHVGFIYRERGMFKEGDKFSAELLKTYKEVPDFYDMRATFFESQKDLKRALSTISDGLKRFPNNEKLLYFEGALLERSGQREKALENMRKVIETNPNNAHALNFLGYTYAEMGTRLQEAEEYVKKALELRPNDGYIEDSFAWVLFKKGNVEEAIQRLEKAVALQPEEPIIFEHFGDVYLAKKDLAKASEMYQKAKGLSQKKDKEMAKKIEAKLAALEKQRRLPSSDSK